MLCQTCSLKDECKTECDELKTYMFENKGYKTTFTNREAVSIQVYEEDGFNESLSEYISNQYYFTENFSQYTPRLKRIVASRCTPKQQEVFKLWFIERLSFAEIGKRLHISTQTAHEHIYGHSVHGGGLIRKLLKYMEWKTT